MLDRGDGVFRGTTSPLGLGGAQSCLCLPRRPWQRGAAESTDGLVRELFPKGADLSRVAEEEARRAFGPINDRPRRALGHRTANEAYREELLHSA